MKAFRYRIRLQVRQVLVEGVRHGKHVYTNIQMVEFRLKFSRTFRMGFDALYL